MSDKVKNNIVQLLSESSQFNTNDVLVNALETNSKLFFNLGQAQFNIEDFPNTIINEAKKNKRESGVNTLCKAEGILKFEYKGSLVNAPIYLSPIDYSVDKIKKELKFDEIEEESFLNPFIANYINDVQPEQKLNGLTDYIKIIDFLQKIGLTNIESSKQIIGNFHHHRYEIIKELEELLLLDAYSNNLTSLLGFDALNESNEINIPNNNLFSADLDHLKVFEAANNGNVVIQGPPGTGKSQVLSNMLGKLLMANKTTIVVSEKRVALEVLQNKLSEFELDKLCFIASSDKLSHAFLQSLKSTWDYFEAYQYVPINNLQLSEQYLDNLQMTLDMLSKDNLIGGVSFHKFHELYALSSTKEGRYSSKVPDINDYLKYSSSISEIYENQLSKSIGRIKKNVFNDDQFLQFDSQVNEWISSLKLLKKNFEFNTWEDYSEVIKIAIDCQIYNNDLYKKYAPIYERNSTEQKRFLSLRKKYLKSKLELEKINANQSHWKIVPSETETKVLINIHKNSSFFTRIKSRKRWNEISNLPYSNALSELENHLKEISHINSFSQIIIKFCELGLSNPENEIELLYRSINQFSEDQWLLIQSLSSEKRVSMTNHHTLLSELYHELKRHFVLSSDTDLLKYLEQLQMDLSTIIPLREKLSEIDSFGLESLLRNESKLEYESELFHSHLVRFKERFPAYAKFKISEISDKIKTIIITEKEEAKLFAREIENSIYSRFKHFHDLLNIPAKKLNEDEKKLKARLRKGKSILVKEFSKSRSHPSLRELYDSEAREWIQLLKPILLSNPAQMSKCFPLEKNLFDVSIFDEASQIPLQNAIGTIQRSARVLVAGDEHQMGPTSYFKSGSVEPLDLLHQANYYWPKVELHHHYRSMHPDLIAFSNRHFYNGELKAFPAYQSTCPLIHHYIDQATFTDRKNLIEAKMIAETLEKALLLDENVGVVAFSEEQLNCIWSNLTSNSQKILSEKIDSNNGFFKSLENVQGDECDRLFISFGYSKNEEGNFNMRFGPMNTSNGRRRLNVLLTRAKKSIEFFCSVHSNDFKLSDNESINLLKNWIRHSENYKPSNAIAFPFNLEFNSHDNKLNIANVHETLPVAKEIVTLHDVLENRGWQVEYS